MSVTPEGFVKAATMWVALPDALGEECYRHGCDVESVVYFEFLAEEEGGSDHEECYVFVCRTHMHGWLGHFLDSGETKEID